MKIAIIGVGLYIVRGGIRRRVELARRLQKKGYDVTLYLRNLKIDPKWKGLELPSKLQEYPLEPIKADFIFWGGDLCGKAVFDKARGKKVFMFQVYIPETEPYLKNHSITKVAFSNSTAKVLENEFKCKPIRAIGGVNLEFFTPSNIQREKIILAQGGAGKRGELAQQAFNLISNNSFNFSILHNCKDQYELREKYRKAFIFISAEQSAKFCWNNPAAEAMACKCPVIVIDHRAIRDHCLHKKTALVVNPNSSSIANSMTTMIKELIKNSELRNRLIENAYKHIQKFNYDKIVNTLEKEVLKR